MPGGPGLPLRLRLRRHTGRLLPWRNLRRVLLALRRPRLAVGLLLAALGAMPWRYLLWVLLAARPLLAAWVLGVRERIVFLRLPWLVLRVPPTVILKVLRGLTVPVIALVAHLSLPEGPYCLS